jgi:hypothetical protein
MSVLVHRDEPKIIDESKKQIIPFLTRPRKAKKHRPREVNMAVSYHRLVDHQMSLPLSAAQLGLWFAQKIDPANPIYNISEYVEIHGSVDPNLFEIALTQAVGDTEAYRARFAEEIDGPRQIIDPPSEKSVPLFDVSAEADPQAAAEAWMKADLAKPIDLLRGPLFFFALFKAAPARFFCYLCMIVIPLSQKKCCVKTAGRLRSLEKVCATSKAKTLFLLIGTCPKHRMPCFGIE